MKEGEEDSRYVVSTLHTQDITNDQHDYSDTFASNCHDHNLVQLLENSLQCWITYSTRHTFLN